MIPNSNPCKGKTPRKEEVAANPKIEDKINEPQEAQPMPKNPIIMPKILTPASFCKPSLFFI